MSTEQPCAGFPDDCPNLRTVEPEWREGHLVHGGGIRCGCNDPSGSLFVDSSQLQVLQIAPPPLFSVGGNGTPKVTMHRDGRLEYGEGYQPGEAARTFWEAVQRLQQALAGGEARQAAYDAVFAYIRSQPRDFLPTTVVDRNAMIWNAVHAALDAVGIPKKED